MPELIPAPCEAARLLFVDDDESWSLLVRRVFDKLAPTWMFDYATDGVVALERIKAIRPTVMVTDIQMPRMDGIRLLEELSKTPRSFPVIVMSSIGDPSVRLCCMDLGIESFLDKPVTSDGLRESLQYILDLTANFVVGSATK